MSLPTVFVFDVIKQNEQSLELNFKLKFLIMNKILLYLLTMFFLVLKVQSVQIDLCERNLFHLSFCNEFFGNCFVVSLVLLLTCVHFVVSLMFFSIFFILGRLSVYQEYIFADSLNNVNKHSIYSNPHIPRVT